MPLTQDERSLVKAWIGDSVDHAVILSKLDPKNGLYFLDHVSGLKLNVTEGVEHRALGQNLKTFLTRGGTSKEELAVFKRDLTPTHMNNPIRCLYRGIIEAEIGCLSIDEKEFAALQSPHVAQLPLYSDRTYVDTFRKIRALPLAKMSFEDLIELREEVFIEKGLKTAPAPAAAAPVATIAGENNVSYAATEPTPIAPSASALAHAIQGATDPLAQLGKGLAFARVQSTQLGAHLPAAHKQLATDLNSTLQHLQELHQQLVTTAKGRGSSLP